MTLKVLRPEKNFGRLLIPFNIIIWSVYLFKVNNGKTRTISETYSELTIKAPERYQWCRSGVFIVNIVTLTCNKLPPLVRVDWPLLALNKKKTWVYYTSVPTLRRCSVLTDFAEFAGNQLRVSLYKVKLEAVSIELYFKRTTSQVLFSKFCKIFLFIV